MNRKTLLALAAVAATGATFAAVTSVNTLCRIALELKSKEAVIALPLVDVGKSGSTIDVTKFVLTDNLVVGTTLQYKSGEDWVGWVLTQEQEDDEKVWTAANVPNSAALTKDLERGGAVLLTRPAEDKEKSRTVYLYGQVSEATVAKVPESGYYLYGNTGTTAMTDVSAIVKTPQNGDQIIVPTTWEPSSGVVVQIFDYYTYTTKTGESAGSWDKELSIPVGAGFWYKR